MSNSKYTNLICVIITVAMVGFMILLLGMVSRNGSTAGASSSEESGTYGNAAIDSYLSADWQETGTTIDLSEDNTYSIDGDIILAQGGTYVLTGQLETGHQILVTAGNSVVQIVLDNVTLENSEQVPIEIRKADAVLITVADGSTNSITVDGTDDSDVSVAKAAIFSKTDLYFNGTGTLQVNAATDAIQSKGDLVFIDGTYNVTTGGGASDSALGQGMEMPGGMGGGNFGQGSSPDGNIMQSDENADSGDDGSANEEQSDGGTASGNAMPDKDGQNSMTPPSGGDSDDIAMPDVSDFNGEMPGMPNGTGATDDSSASEEQPEMSGNMTPPSGGDSDDTAMPNGGGFAGGKQGMMNGNDATDDSSASEKQPIGNASGDMTQQKEGKDSSDTNSSDTNSSNVNSFNNEAASSTTTNADASMKGLKAEGKLWIVDGTYTLNTADDAIHSNSDVVIDQGTITIASTDDGMHGDDSLTINNGTITVSQSNEGLEAECITINDGTIDVTASDDGMNASSGDGGMGFGAFNASGEVSDSLTINGGTIHVDAGGDGLDSNGDEIINGGTIVVDGPTNSGNGALDSGTESGGVLLVNGGSIVALGASGMAECFEEDSEQGYLSCTFSSYFAADETLTIADSAGNVIFEYTIQKSGNNVIFSSADIVNGQTYTLTVGDQTQEVTAGETQGAGGFSSFMKNR